MLKLKPKNAIIPREITSPNTRRTKRRRAIRLKFEPSSNNFIVVEEIKTLDINKPNSASMNFEENIQRACLEKAHSIPLITLRYNKSLALRSQSYPCSIQDLDPDYIPYL